MQFHRYSRSPHVRRTVARAPARVPRSGRPAWVALLAALCSATLALVTGYTLVVRVQVLPAASTAPTVAACPAVTPR